MHAWDGDPPRLPNQDRSEGRDKSSWIWICCVCFVRRRQSALWRPAAFFRGGFLLRRRQSCSYSEREIRGGNGGCCRFSHISISPLPFLSLRGKEEEGKLEKSEFSKQQRQRRGRLFFYSSHRKKSIHLFYISLLLPPPPEAEERKWN